MNNKPDRVLFIPANIGWTKDQIANYVNGEVGSPGARLCAADITDAEAQTFANIWQGHLIDCSDGAYEGEDEMAEAEEQLLKTWAQSLASWKEPPPVLVPIGPRSLEYHKVYGTLDTDEGKSCLRADMARILLTIGGAI